MMPATASSTQSSFPPQTTLGVRQFCPPPHEIANLQMPASTSVFFGNENIHPNVMAPPTSTAATTLPFQAEKTMG